MSLVVINLSIVRVKSDSHQIYAVCPFCNHYSKTYQGFRTHLARFHKNESCIEQVRKHVSKLYRVYQRGIK